MTCLTRILVILMLFAQYYGDENKPTESPLYQFLFNDLMDFFNSSSAIQSVVKSGLSLQNMASAAAYATQRGLLNAGFSPSQADNISLDVYGSTLAADIDRAKIASSFSNVLARRLSSSGNLNSYNASIVANILEQAYVNEFTSISSQFGIQISQNQS